MKFLFYRNYINFKSFFCANKYIQDSACNGEQTLKIWKQFYVFPQANL